MSGTPPKNGFQSAGTGIPFRERANRVAAICDSFALFGLAYKEEELGEEPAFRSPFLVPLHFFLW